MSIYAHKASWQQLLSCRTTQVPYATSSLSASPPVVGSSVTVFPVPSTLAMIRQKDELWYCPLRLKCYSSIPNSFDLEQSSGLAHLLFITSYRQWQSAAILNVINNTPDIKPRLSANWHQIKSNQIEEASKDVLRWPSQLFDSSAG